MTTTASVTYTSASAAFPHQYAPNPTEHLMFTSWQETLRKRWEERDRREKAHDEIIHQYQKLAKHAALMKERSNSLLQAASLGVPAPNTASLHGRAASASATQSAGTTSPAPDAASAAAAATTSNPVQEAYIKSLETQLSGLRDELSELYKTQSQNAQRLLTLNEELRARADKGKDVEAETMALREERDRLTRSNQDLKENVKEKDKTIVLLQDELTTLSLELNQIELRNDELKRDNASLLQRWLDKMNEEADKMNDANVYLEEVKKRKQETSTTSSSSTSTATAAEADSGAQPAAASSA